MGQGLGSKQVWGREVAAAHPLGDGFQELHDKRETKAI